MNKTLSFDVEVVQKLQKEANASDLVNSLIKKHYDSQSIKGRTREELLKIREILVKKDALQKELKEMGIDD